MNAPRQRESWSTSAGSPAEGEPAFLVIGKIRRPHGVHGEVLMEVYTDFPERYLPGVTVFIGEKNEAVVISSCRMHKDGLLIRFAGCDTPEAAGIFRNQLVFVRADDRPALEEGEYYQHQLLGLKVYDQEERRIGVVAEILETGASDVLVVRGETGEESMIPYVDEFVLEVNLAEGMMRVHLLPGMTTKQ